MRYTDDDVVLELARAIELAGGVRRFAEAADISATFVSLVANRRCRPGPRIAAYLGFVEDDKRWVRQK